MQLSCWMRNFDLAVQTDEFGRISQGILLLSPQAHQGQAKLQEQFLSAVNQPVSSLFEEQQPTEVQITSSYSQMQYGSNLPTLLSVDSSFAEPPLPSSSNSSYSCTPRLLKLKRFRCPPTAINNDGCKGTSSSSGNSGDMGDGGEGESGRWVYVCSHGGLVYIRLVADQFVNFVKQQSYSNDIARPLPPPSDRFSQSLLITSFGMIDHVIYPVFLDYSCCFDQLVSHPLMHFIPNNDLKRLFNALKSPPHLPTNVLTCCVRWAFRTSWKAPCLVSSSRNAKDGGGGDVGASYSTAGAFYYSDDEEDFFPLNQQEDTIGGIKTDSAYTYDFKAQGSYNKNITITNKRNSLSRSDSDSNSHGDTYSRFFPSKKSVLLGKILSSFTSLINSIEFSTSSSSSSSASSSPRFKQYVWVEIKCIPLSSNNNHPYSGIKYNASPSLPPYFVMSIRVLDVPKAKALMEANVTAASSKMSEQSLVKIPGIWNIFKSVTTKFLFCLDEGLEQLERICTEFVGFIESALLRFRAAISLPSTDELPSSPPSSLGVFVSGILENPVVKGWRLLHHYL